MVCLSLKRIVRRPLYALPVLLFFVASFAFLFYHWRMRWNLGVDVSPLLYLGDSLKLAIVAFVFFMFSAYELVAAARTRHCEEVIDCTRRGRVAFEMACVAACALIAAAYTVLLIVANAAIYLMLEIRRPAYLAHIVVNLIFNVYLQSLLGIVFGVCLALLKRRLGAYLAMLALAVLASPLKGLITGPVYDGLRSNGIFVLTDLFAFYPPCLELAPIAAFGYSLLPYRWFLLLFWICLLLACLFWATGRRRRRDYLPALLSTVLAVAFLIVYFAPHSKVDCAWDDPRGASRADMDYYEAQPQDDEPIDFSVLAYALDFDVGLELGARATLTLSDASRPRYGFTLYHGYRVARLEDARGRPIDFERDRDYLRVENRDAYDMSRVTFHYAGSSPRYFSNVQGVFLPAFFPYYPRAGVQTIYGVNSMDFVPIAGEPVCDYTLQLSGPGQHVCNLEALGRGRYAGRSDGLSILGGMYDVDEVDGVRVVVPYLERGLRLPREGMAQEIAQLKADPALRHVKTIMIMPKLVWTASLHAQYAGYEDHVLATGGHILHRQLQEAMIPWRKHPIVGLLRKYRDFNELYRQQLADFKDELARSPELESLKDNLYILFDARLKALGEAELLAHCRAYLEDEADRRDAATFLKDMEVEP